MRDVAVIGTGIHKFGRFPDKDVLELGKEAVLMALKEAEIDWKDVQSVFCGNTRAGIAPGNRLASLLGETGVPVINVNNACATAGIAFKLACESVASGLCDISLAIGMEKLPRGYVLPNAEDDSYLRFKIWGIPNPAYWAMRCRKHMELYGTTMEQMARVSVKNHKNAVHNPYALYQKELTFNEVMESKVVCDPLTLLMICAADDGAAAAVVCSMDEARKRTTKPVRVGACEISSHVYGGCFEMPDGSRPSKVPLFPHALTVNAAKRAYEAAGLGPEDLSVVELQDTSAFNEIEYAEALGLCKDGEGGLLIDQGISEIGGKLPINPSGGLLSCGEPVGASGLRQVVDIVWQLRGVAGARQVENAKVGLGHTVGGAGNCSVIILKV